MTPEEKAKELIQDISNIGKVKFLLNHAEIKELAILVVREIDRHVVRNTPKDDPYSTLITQEWWGEVKQEIEKL